MGLRYAPLPAYLPPAFRFGGGKYDDDFAVRQRREKSPQRRFQYGLLFLQDDDRDVRHVSLFFFLFREAATTRSTVSGSGV